MIFLFENHSKEDLVKKMIVDNMSVGNVYVYDKNIYRSTINKNNKLLTSQYNRMYGKASSYIGQGYIFLTDSVNKLIYAPEIENQIEDLEKYIQQIMKR